MNVFEFSLKNSTKTFDLLGKEADLIPVHEFDSVSFRLVVDEPSQLTLLLGDYSFWLENYTVMDGQYVYQSDYKQTFKNFVGITHAEIVATDDEDREIIAVSRPINVYASKISYERALSFLRYIISNEDISSVCFTVTKGGSDAERSSNNLTEKLIAGLRVVDYLNNEWGRFHHDPCTKNSSRATVGPFSRSMPVDDRTIAYLSEHPDSLTRADAASGDVLIRGQYYAIQQMLQSKIVHNLNIFENQVILYFLKSFYQFVLQLKAELAKKQTSQTTIMVNGIDYISLDQILQDSGIFLTFHKEKLDVACSGTRLALNRLQREFKCVLDSSKSLLPIPTQQVLSKTHYITLYRFMDEYNKIGEPSWRGTSELYGIRNISKLYEFVSLINIQKSLKLMGFNLESAKYINSNGVEMQRPLNDPCNLYVFDHGSGSSVKLLYDIQAARLDGLADPVPGRLYDMKRYNNTRRLRPDFQIRYIGAHGTKCHIFDAKYSDQKNVLGKHMPECAAKYGLETRVYKLVNGKPQLTVPDSMTIIYSGNAKPYESMYRTDLTGGVAHLVANSKPQIGSIGVFEGEFKLLTSTLKQFLEK